MKNNTYNKLLYKKYELIKNAIEENDCVKLYVTGSSMEPYFIEGDLITIIRCYEEDLEVGLIILFVSNKGDLVFHRIAEILGDTFIVKGDNEAYLECLRFEDVLGKFSENSMVNDKTNKTFIKEATVDDYILKLKLMDNILMPFTVEGK